MFATMFRWVSTAALETPVVPPVYCRKAMSPGWTSGPLELQPETRRQRPLEGHGAGDAPGRHLFADVAQREIHQRAAGLPSRSPIPVTITLVEAVRGSTCCSTCAKFSTMTMRFAPESLIWCSSSRGV